MATNPLLELRALGQSVWLDDLHRAMLEDGSLELMIREDGLRGQTSNPAILAAAITRRPEYADALTALLGTGLDALGVYEALALEDVGRAADLFRPVYEETGGRDGYVSIEVSPHLAHDTVGTIAEARRLWRALGRENVMIKIPGTIAGLEAIRSAISEGINVNVTLLFSPERYREVADAYCAGLEDRLARGERIDRPASVASFFLSRIDTLVDRRLDELARAGQSAARALRGKSAVACASRAYEIYCEIIASGRWQRLQEAGARTQRLLWASTSTKDPAYSPIKYVEELIAFDTVSTVPPETFEAYKRLGRPELRLEQGLAEASDVREALEHLGIDLEDVAAQLEKEGVRKFIEPFDGLQAWLEKRRREH